MTPDSARNIDFVGHHDLDGRGDGVQIMVHKGHAFIGHMFSDGFTVVDVRDPKHPQPVNFVAAPPNTRAFHLQTHGDLLLTVNSPNIWVMQGYSDPNDYFKASITDTFTKRDKTLHRRPAGLRHLQAGRAARDRLHAGRRAGAASPLVCRRPLRLCLVPLAGLHRPCAGDHRHGRADPAGGGRPLLAARDERRRPARRRAGRASAMRCTTRLSPATSPTRAWRDGGMTILDVGDPTAPKLLAHRNWCPPFGGGTHTPLPLPDRNLAVFADEGNLDNCANGIQRCWVFDVREPTNPVQIATFPTPAEEDYCAKGAKFGPHNLHENRPGSFQSSELIFATYQNAGVRVFDIRDPFQPQRGGAFRAAGAREDGRSAPQPAAHDPVQRRLCRAGRADVPDRRQ